MTMQEWVNMLDAVCKGKEVLIPAQLHLKGQLADLSLGMGGIAPMKEYFEKVLEAQPAEIKEINQ